MVALKCNFLRAKQPNLASCFLFGLFFFLLSSVLKCRKFEVTALIKEHRRHLSHCRAWYDRTANYYAIPPTSDRGQWHLRPSNRDFSTHQRVRHQNSFARAIGYATILRSGRRYNDRRPSMYTRPPPRQIDPFTMPKNSVSEGKRKGREARLR